MNKKTRKRDEKAEFKKKIHRKFETSEIDLFKKGMKRRSEQGDWGEQQERPQILQEKRQADNSRQDIIQNPFWVLASQSSGGEGQEMRPKTWKRWARAVTGDFRAHKRRAVRVRQTQAR